MVFNPIIIIRSPPTEGCSQTLKYGSGTGWKRGRSVVKATNDERNFPEVSIAPTLTPQVLSGQGNVCLGEVVAP